MKSKKLIIILGVILLVLGAIGVFKLVTILQTESAIVGLGVMGLVIFVIFDIYTGTYLIKNRDKIYAKLNVPVGPYFKKSLPKWIVVYTLILLSLIVLSDYFNV